MLSMDRRTVAKRSAWCLAVAFGIVCLAGLPELLGGGWVPGNRARHGLLMVKQAVSLYAKENDGRLPGSAEVLHGHKLLHAPDDPKAQANICYGNWNTEIVYLPRPDVRYGERAELPLAYCLRPYWFGSVLSAAVLFCDGRLEVFYKELPPRRWRLKKALRRYPEISLQRDDRGIAEAVRISVLEVGIAVFVLSLATLITSSLRSAIRRTPG